jgi:hypothetical protein
MKHYDVSILVHLYPFDTSRPLRIPNLDLVETKADNVLRPAWSSSGPVLEDIEAAG